MKKILRNKIFQLPVLALLVGFLLISLVGQNLNFLKSSVVSLPEHKAFDGTVYPILKAPDWSSLSADRYSLDYDAYLNDELVDMPYYDPQKLATSAADLTWGNEADNLIRNAKITYSVPYMGSYELDGQEYAGSHLAVDIKTPMNTPVYAIANGVVSKAAVQSTGFGNHIVLTHNNAYSFDSKDERETLYSSYSHLNKVLVEVGDVVEKGDLIALSGSTGTSTTPHLHFQIDNSSAPWHPYWHFTYSEALEAGYDFYSAINAGFAKDKALSTTINPMVYVQKYMDLSESSASSDDFTEETQEENEEDDVLDVVDEESLNFGNQDPGSYVEDSNQEANLEEEEEEEVVSQDDDLSVIEEEEEIEEVEEVVYEDPVLNFVFDVPESVNFSKGDLVEVSVKLRDQYDRAYKDGFKDDILIATENNNVQVKSPLATAVSFDSDFEYHTQIVAKADGRDRLKVVYNGEVYASDWFDLNEVSSSEEVFSDLDIDEKYKEAVLYLYEEDIIQGYSDGTFRPNQVVSRVEALKFIYKGLGLHIKAGDLDFIDLDDPVWYQKYLYTAFKSGVVKGYDDGSFRPNNTVTHAEFYKMLVEAMEIDLVEDASISSFKDLDTSNWASKYFETALVNLIIEDGVDYVYPSEGMTRAEVAYAIYRALK